MPKYINTEGAALICSGVDPDPASPTVGSNVVHWSRPLTAEELATAADYLRRIDASAVNPREGQERYGEVLTAQAAWINGLPRDARADLGGRPYATCDGEVTREYDSTTEAASAAAQHGGRVGPGSPRLATFAA